MDMSVEEQRRRQKHQRLLLLQRISSTTRGDMFKNDTGEEEHAQGMLPKLDVACKPA